jgi:hypothetical protein
MTSAKMNVTSEIELLSSYINFSWERIKLNLITVNCNWIIRTASAVVLDQKIPQTAWKLKFVWTLFCDVTKYTTGSVFV